MKLHDRVEHRDMLGMLPEPTFGSAMKNGLTPLGK